MNNRDKLIEARWASHEGQEWPKDPTHRLAAIVLVVALFVWITLLVVDFNSFAANIATEFFGIVIEVSLVVTIVGWVLQKQEERKWSIPLEYAVEQLFYLEKQLLDACTEISTTAVEHFRHCSHPTFSDHRNSRKKLTDCNAFADLIQGRYEVVLMADGEAYRVFQQQRRLIDELTAEWKDGFNLNAEHLRPLFKKVLRAVSKVCRAGHTKLRLYVRGSKTPKA